MNNPPKTFLSAIVIFLAGAATTMASTTVTIINNLPASPACNSDGNSLSIFVPYGQQNSLIKPNGGQNTYLNIPSSGGLGLGIQVNNWYWTFSDGQNPDNSCGDYLINPHNCTLIPIKCESGNGYPTDVITQLTTSGQDGNCILTVTVSTYTNSVTPKCCSPGTCNPADINKKYYQGAPPLPH